MTAASHLVRWENRAACAGADTDLWFGRPSETQFALQTCTRCPVRAECLHDALSREEHGARRFGIRGGLYALERDRLPALPTAAAEAIAALRELLATHERTPVITGPAAHPESPAADVQLTSVTSDTAILPVGQLLAWGEQHSDTEIQDQAARARAALAGLRKRHAADQELLALANEREQLQQRLAELAAREAELAPSKPKKKRAYVRDYDPRTVRAWADANGIECARIGQVPKRVLDAWRAAGSPSS